MVPRASGHILVVDDDPSIRRLLGVLLKRAGYEIDEAADGEEAYARVMQSQPTMIVTDWNMPRVDGVQLIRRIRSADLPWYPYILLLTASDDQQQGLDSGADDFVSKPIRAEQVLPRIRAGQRVVALQETLREKNLQLNESIDRLAKLAVADSMTGLLNRRAFREQAQREWNRAERYDLPLSCLMLDIDLFKRVNDTYGHAAGDIVICRLAEALKERFRDSDILCRYGGEEFCLLLTNTPGDAAVLMAERLRQLITQTELPEIGHGFSFTVSCGAAMRSLNTLSVEALIDHADQALLIAKRTGRNRVVRQEEIELSLSMLGNHETALPKNDASRTDSAALIPYHIVNTLLTVLNYRDPPTVRHSQRVARLCTNFGHHLEFAPAERLTLEVAALLHDAGKLAIPDEILNKTGRLTDKEFAIARRHREVTVDILNSCFSNQRLIDLVRFSGQAYDGSRGDPSGETIPQGSRMLAIASLFDDIRHGRAWWQPRSREDAVKTLRQRAGSTLDPLLVEKFAEMIAVETVSTIETTTSGTLSSTESSDVDL